MTFVAAHSIRELEAPQEMRKPVVLVVDESDFVIRFVARMLEHRGFEIRAARTPEEAFAICRAETVDLVLAEPAPTGREPLGPSSLRAAGVVAPLVLLSAGRPSPEALEAEFPGADAYFLKPFFAEDLLASIGELVDG